MINGLCMCSNSELMQLARGGCQESNCMYSCQVCYKIVSSCTEIDGICWNGHGFYWSSSDFHTSAETIRYLTVICWWHQGLFCQETTMSRLTNFLTSWEWLLFVSYLSIVTNSPSVEKFYAQEQVNLMVK